MLLVATPVPAWAGSYPPGSDEWASSEPFNISWSDNCWVGESYDRNGNYTTGVQRILQGFFHYTGTIDGLWGPLTLNAVKDYQSTHGLAVDGIVGPNTWLELWQDEQSYSQLGCWSGYCHYGGGWNTTYIALRYRQNANEEWYVLGTGGSVFWGFAVWGPNA